MGNTSNNEIIDQTNVGQTIFNQTIFNQTNIDQTNIDQTNVNQTNVDAYEIISDLSNPETFTSKEELSELLNIKLESSKRIHLDLTSKFQNLILNPIDKNPIDKNSINKNTIDENTILSKIQLINAIDSIENLDIKHQINFLQEFTENIMPKKIKYIELSTSNIYIIDDFLTEFETNNIIKQSEIIGFEHLSYRNSDRLIGLDSNHLLCQTLSDRLSHSIEQINELKPVRPYGFNSYNINWLKNKSSDINPCIRINKYINSGFDYHRDAQLTVSELVKSNYTLLIYLNDDFDDGYTKFIINSDLNQQNQQINSTYTVNNEVKQILKSKHQIFRIKPKRGRAIIFDQRLIHMGELNIGTKYILRTDLIVSGEYKSKSEHISTSLIDNLHKLTKCLFRQAQLNELIQTESIQTESINLYDICIKLRQYPELIKSYPIDLEQHIKYLSTPNSDLILCNSKLRFIKRTSITYEFEFDTNRSNIFELVKIAGLFSVLGQTSNITTEFVEMFNSMLESIDFSSLSSDTLYTDNLSEYYNLTNVEQLSFEWISKLVDNIRIKSSGHVKRTVFDLTNAIRMIDSKLSKSNAKLSKSNVKLSKFNAKLLKSNAKSNNKLTTNYLNNFEIVNFKDFTNNYDCSLYKTLNKLFGINRKINPEFYMEQIADSNYHDLPLATHGLISTADMFININQSNNCCLSINRHVYNQHAIGIYHMKFITHIGNYIINFVKLDLNTNSGIIDITAPTKYFNHASCRCERVTQLNDINIIKHIYITYKIEFQIISNQILIKLVPNVVI